jgi:hypothetical protein
MTSEPIGWAVTNYDAASDLWEWVKRQPSALVKKPHEQFIDMLTRLRYEREEYVRLIEEAIP